MNELERIGEVLRSAVESGGRVLLATVVGCAGSTYRKIGARMAVTSEGRSVGSISGGCLEADVVARWERLAKRGVPELVVYDTGSHHDLLWGSGLGCNGRVEVLLEPLAGTALADAHACLALALGAESGALATVVRSDAPGCASPGARFFVDASGEIASACLVSAQWISEVEAIVADGLVAVAAGRRNRRSHRIGRARIEILWEPVTAAPRLCICGAGADAVPVAALAAQLGWKVRLFDHRPAFASAERFPCAESVRLVPPGTAAAALAGTRADAVVVMSHHFERDLEYLGAALASSATYVGVLGPSARTEHLLAELARRGDPPSPAARARLYSPVGLDLGAETPEEIAFSIVSELLAVQRGRSAGSLRERAVARTARFDEISCAAG
jgi:xanthine/CO dehydrogenase XdhC/CoxF family maturation factor